MGSENSIVVIHGIRNTLETMDELLKQRFPEYAVFHLYDQYLAWEPEYRKEFSQTNLNRFLLLLKSAELTGAKVILLACSVPCLYVDALRPLIKPPVFGILDATVNVVLKQGGNRKVGFFSTSRASSETLLALLQKKAGEKYEVERVICNEAFSALQRGDLGSHDRLILEEAEKLKGMDLVVLTQLSMSRLRDEIRSICGCPVINTEQPCLEELALFLESSPVK